MWIMGSWQFIGITADDMAFTGRLCVRGHVLTSLSPRHAFMSPWDYSDLTACSNITRAVGNYPIRKWFLVHGSSLGYEWSTRLQMWRVDPNVWACSSG
jgi:hypothetical protein